MIPDKAFYVSPQNIESGQFVLDPDESNHLINVLRLSINQEIFLLDGKGNGYHSIIKKVSKAQVSGEIIKTFVGYGENQSSIYLAPAIIKRDRFETLLEKSIELGVKEIQPLLLDRCIKKTLNLARCEKIITSSAKQCRRSYFPKIKDPIDLGTLLANNNGDIFVGSQKEKNKLSDIKLIKKNQLHLIIGPEGDFSDHEYELMYKHKVQFFNLGQRRLRSETASLASLSILNEIMV